jgi:polyferredoxin
LRIVTIRRISQVFFLALFTWLAVVTTWGDAFRQLRGWPVEAFLQFDPLVAMATALATGVLYAGLAWALVTIVLTIVLGRFFCGWVCPFGTLHQALGWLGRSVRPGRAVRANQPHRAQAIKYHLLAFLAAAASGDALVLAARAAADAPWWAFGALSALSAAAAFAALARALGHRGKAALATALLLATFLAMGRLLPGDRVVASTLQIGLLDPIALLTRSVGIVALPVADRSTHWLFTGPRFTQGAGLIGGIALAALLANLLVPRFYCRFVCPLGALLGLLARNALWRIGQAPASACTQCRLCEADCEGACAPSGRIRTPECVLCMNCIAPCEPRVMGYRTAVSEAGEEALPDVSRRGVVLSLASGLLAVPAIRVAGRTAGPDWHAGLVRPPGALPEDAFLDRCLKCGLCMRVCPTGVLQPAGAQHGIEALWTPVLNNRIGTSGCQLNCVACGDVCPTGAIRPFTLDAKIGRGAQAQDGPIRMGTAFIDPSRCLPWAMDRPCIVCQEVCPVSPKAIHWKPRVAGIRDGLREVIGRDGDAIRVTDPPMVPGRLGSGDYRCRVDGRDDLSARRIVGNTANTLVLAPGDWGDAPAPGAHVVVEAVLQLPFVDPDRCTGCGICEHDCPVRGIPAIRVTAENESRHPDHTLARGPGPGRSP